MTYTPDRQLTPPDPLIHCDCGHNVRESEMHHFVYMGGKTERSACDKCYDEWLEEDLKKEEFDAYWEILNTEL